MHLETAAQTKNMSPKSSPSQQCSTSFEKMYLSLNPKVPPASGASPLKPTQNFLQMQKHSKQRTGGFTNRRHVTKSRCESASMRKQSLPKNDCLKCRSFIASQSTCVILHLNKMRNAAGLLRRTGFMLIKCPLNSVGTVKHTTKKEPKKFKSRNPWSSEVLPAFSFISAPILAHQAWYMFPRCTFKNTYL